ncbi:hypothetical protein BJY01DRAFT_263698, partial [Aspergillus pseudoustus]
MALQLPLELVDQIAQYRRRDARSYLAQYALVCRNWQAAFEPYIYDQLCVHSEDYLTGKGIITLAHFQSLTSTTHHAIARRKMVREIIYRVILPFDLPDYKSIVTRARGPTYKLDNAVRIANDDTFKAGVLNLFNILTSWGAECRLTLCLRTIGRDEDVIEPGTERVSSASDYYDYARGKWAVRPYRAQFPKSIGVGQQQQHPQLPSALCVGSLEFEGPYFMGDRIHRYEKPVWPEAACCIAQACPAFSHFRWEAEDDIRPDHLDYMQQRRESFANGLLRLPSTLRKFEFLQTPEPVFHQSFSAPLLAPSAIDLFSTNLRIISVRLEKLLLCAVPLANDFLCPLDSHGEPRGECMVWPNLKELEIQRGNFLPEGVWLLDPTSDTEDAGIDDLDDSASDYTEQLEDFMANDFFCYRAVLKTELCHLANISLGYAARCMPRLESIDFYFTFMPDTFFAFEREEAGEGNVATLMWKGKCGYRPDERVARAWGFKLGEVNSETEVEEDERHVHNVMISNWSG